ncbi:GAF domain-containing protein [Shimia sp.]|uniref:GAF domain-containing protein n=1 Tax=Shimia sp. TaxID=1954381 RepID=UPI003299D819
MRKISHAEKVLETTQSHSAAARSRVAASWNRSAIKHGLDPAEMRVPERIDQSALHHRRAELEKFMTVTGPRMDLLFSLIGQSGCGVFLTDADGVILDQRLSEADAPVFGEWGLSTGADWSEEREGTNGIGTCLTEQRQLIIHQDEHFFSRNTAMSCIDSPIYDSDGHVLAALDVSSARADQTETFNRLIAAQVAQTARAIEEANFRAAFPKARVVVVESEDAEASTLLAIDEYDLVIGATREARRIFGMDAVGTIVPRPAVDVLGREDGPTGFEKAERAAVVRAISRAGGNVSQAARQLGIGRATLYRRMKRLGLDES